MQQVDLIGQVLGGCRINTLLGKGGMGYVFLAHHLNLDIPIALKLLNSTMTSSPELVERFILEARAAAKLDSNNIVRVMQVGEEKGFYYIQMEYIEGESLAKYLKRNIPLEIPLALHFLKQIASGLHDAHLENIVHRDIKPDNVLINKKGTLKIADFGLVKVTESDNNLTATGQVLGTPYYISPEQCEGKAVDCRSDIYSLGIVMYYMLTGHLPFEGESSLVIVISRLQKDPPLMSEYRKDIPAEINKFVLTMMQRKPEDRQQNAETLLEQINNLINQFAQDYKYKATKLEINVSKATNFPPTKSFSSTGTISDIVVNSSSSTSILPNEQVITSAKTITDTNSQISAITPTPLANNSVQTMHAIKPETSHQIATSRKKKTSGFILPCCEIIFAILVAFVVVHGVWKKQTFLYSHIYDQSFGHPHSLLYGDAVQKYHDTVSTVVDQKTDVALNKIEIFLSQYGYTPYAEVIKNLQNIILSKKAFLLEVNKQLESTVITPMQIKLIPPPLFKRAIKDNEYKLRFYAKNAKNQLAKLPLFLSLEIEIQDALDKHLQILRQRADEYSANFKSIENTINIIFKEFEIQLLKILESVERNVTRAKSRKQLTKIAQEGRENVNKIFLEIVQKIDSLKGPSQQRERFKEKIKNIVHDFQTNIEKTVEKKRTSFKNNERPTSKDRQKIIDVFFKRAHKMASNVGRFKGQLLRTQLKFMESSLKRNNKNPIIFRKLKKLSKLHPQLNHEVSKLMSELQKAGK
ncbi:protein kinase [Candidatus Uabimicrobium sp. HlEnr_7]|uniref:serine/threonine-protein kinase n=1 Tax=Candidatus Uabimicrobium helgolandensis TaxID=3095367 RepID=UPI003558228A